MFKQLLETNCNCLQFRYTIRINNYNKQNISALQNGFDVLYYKYYNKSIKIIKIILVNGLDARSDTFFCHKTVRHAC